MLTRRGLMLGLVGLPVAGVAATAAQDGGVDISTVSDETEVTIIGDLIVNGSISTSALISNGPIGG